MKKNRILILLCILAAAVCLIAGCSSTKSSSSGGTSSGQQKEQTAEELQAAFSQKLAANDWSGSVMDYSGTLHFNADGTGTLTLDSGRSKDFKYTLSNVKSNGKEASITLNGTGIEQADGKTGGVSFNDNGELKLSYSVFNVTLTAV